MAKKKKPVANPARGFATTSVASKPKVETETPDPPAVDIKSAGKSTGQKPSNGPIPTETVASVVTTANQPSELHDLTPDELEARLHASELQQFVEKYAGKVRKESARQSTRYQTEKRLLRSQAEFLSLKEWLPEELMQKVLALTLSDLRFEANAVAATATTRAARPPGGNQDDLVAKVWTVRQCLLDLDFTLGRVDEALAWLVGNPPAGNLTNPAWGIEECFEWLALHCEPEEMEEYDSMKSTRPLEADDDSEDELDAASNPTPIEKPESVAKSSPVVPAPLDDGPDVSDLESDLEPDELLQAWLKTKSTLFELNPNITGGETRKNKGSRNGKASGSMSGSSRAEQKLSQKLQKIESDVLFDQREAEAHWASMRIVLVREASERKRLQLDAGSDETKTTRNGNKTSTNVNDEAEAIAQELLQEAADDEDLLGGMFDSLPGVQPAAAGPDAPDSATLTIRDFSRITGMNPKRILEEACKARDTRVKLTYKQVSQTTYSCRHSLFIQWGKAQEIISPEFLPVVTVKHKARSLLLTMVEIATPDLASSEAYIATVALFLIFSGSPKEEKAHLRLPAAFRDLWTELSTLRNERVQAEDGAIVEEVRTIVENGRRRDDDDDDDEVVFDASIRRRLDGSTGTSTPASRTEGSKAVSPEHAQELQQIWARKSESARFQHMLVGRQTLPMFRFKVEALETIRRHQVTILCGETGCGKSTQLPAFVLEHELSNGRPCKIYCTEPRRISAISLAQRVSEEMGEARGDLGTSRSLVGYAIRLESHTVPQTRLIYATVGIVLRMLENADGLNDVTHLIIDEVHERSIDTDFLLIILRSLLTRRADLKVVLMSATVDAQRFSQYLDGAPIINVPGRTFPVKPYFLEDAIELTGHTNEDAAAGLVDEDSLDDERPKEDAGQALIGYSRRTQKVLEGYDEYRIDFSLIVKLLEKIGHHADFEPFSKAILVFLPGIAEIRQLNDMLGGHPRFMKGWQVYPLHSTFSSEDQQAAFEVPPPGIRKIVLATNIAETGITIPDVTCVIDTGKHKEMRFDERRQMSRLIQSFIARANAKQRRGRAGRVQEGICFHLFTKHRHDTLMVDQQTPEMLRLSLQDLVMRVKICKLGDIEHALAQALDPPSSKNIRRAIDALVEVGALTTGEDLTPLGSQLAKIPLDAQLGKLILLGSTFGCLDFALTAAATLSSKSPFLSPLHQKKQADTVRLGFRRGDSDLLTIYNAYSAWRKTCQMPGLSEQTFCHKNFLSAPNLANIEDLKAQLLSSLVDAGFVQLDGEERQALSRLRQGQHHRHRQQQRPFVLLPAKHTRADDNDLVAAAIIAASFYPKIIVRDGRGWRNLATNQALALHPTSVNKGPSLAPEVKYLSFYSIMQSGGRFTNAQETSAVPDVALALLAGDAVFHLYAGVVVIDGNRLRLKVRDPRALVLFKALRGKVREALAKALRYPGRELGDRSRRWLDVLETIFANLKPANVAPPLPLAIR